jgi:hypothetical protein
MAYSSTVKLGAVRSSELLVNFYHTAALRWRRQQLTWRGPDMNGVPVKMGELKEQGG